MRDGGLRYPCYCWPATARCDDPYNWCDRGHLVTALDPGTVAGHPAVPDLTAHLLREHRVAPWMVLVASPESPGQYHAWLHAAADQIRTLEAHL
jgi:hypothetical protein